MWMIAVWLITQEGKEWLRLDEHSLQSHPKCQTSKQHQIKLSSFPRMPKKTNRTNNTSQTDSQCVLCETTKCPSERRRQLNVRREECLRISIHYGFQNGPFIMMCAESRKRAIKVTTICLSPPPKSWHSDCLKGKTTQLKNSCHVPPAWHDFSASLFFVFFKFPILQRIH